MELVLAQPVDRRTTYLAADRGDRAPPPRCSGSRSSPAFSPVAFPPAARPSWPWRRPPSYPVCAGVGALASQLAPNRRVALQLGFGVIGLLFMLRVIADTASGAGWLRWATPLGWAENLRPFTAPSPRPAAADRRDGPAPAGGGAHPRAPRRRHRPAARARRRGPAAAPALLADRAGPARRAREPHRWTAGVAVFAFMLGVVSESVTSGEHPRRRAGPDREARRRLAPDPGRLPRVRLRLLRPHREPLRGGAGRRRARAEAEQQLETLFALPVGRTRGSAGAWR